jgi:hypothetical protein
VVFFYLATSTPWATPSALMPMTWLPEARGYFAPSKVLDLLIAVALWGLCSTCLLQAGGLWFPSRVRCMSTGVGRRSDRRPGEHEVWPGRSAVIRHAFGMLLMAVKLEDSSSTRVSAVSFVLDYFLHCGRWRSSRLWQRRSTAATGAGCFCKGLMCNFSFIQECPIRGLVVKVLYQ